MVPGAVDLDGWDFDDQIPILTEGQFSEFLDGEICD
jgi:hypothetical protein